MLPPKVDYGAPAAEARAAREAAALRANLARRKAQLRVRDESRDEPPAPPHEYGKIGGRQQET